MFKIEKVAPRVYCAVFDKPYDLSMTFLRYQEFYEGEDSRFRGHSFKILDFMEWYCHNQKRTKDNGLVFSYNEDWGGFNIPGRIIREVVKAGIPDRNLHDHTMLAISSLIQFQLEHPEEDFYLIGVTEATKPDCVPHELAHGLYYTNDKYHNEMNKLVQALPATKREAIFEVLRATGYADEVLVDETQAYLATGIDDELAACGIKKYLKPFENTYKKFADEAQKQMLED
jgi:hypothetical protein